MAVFLRATGWRLLVGANLLIAFALGAAGSAAAQQPVQRFFRLGTGPSEGTYFPIGGLIASAISSPPGARPCERGGSCGVPGLIAVAQSTRGSVENLRLIARGELESGFCQADIAFAAFHGFGGFAKARIVGLRAIASLYKEAVHIVVRADSGISTVADLKGRTIAVGEQGSGTLVDAEAILGAYKLRRKDLHLQFLKPGPASEALREGRIDGFFLVAAAPALALAELAEKAPIRLLPVSGEAMTRLRRGHPVFGKAVIAEGTYRGAAAVETVTLGVEWLVSAELDSDLVYGITKALWDKSTRKLLESGRPEGREIRIEAALDGLAVPIHPGAERFYREAGVLK